MPLNLPIPARIPLLYVILGVLLAISVLPMYFYSAQIETMNRERLKTNEMLLQNTVTRSLADDISQHREALHMMLANLSSSIQVMMLANPSDTDLSAQKFLTPELRAMLENFVSSSNDIAYATLLNADAKGVSAGRIEPDAFLQRELERAYQAAREGRGYSGQPLVVGSGKSARTVMLVSSPIMYDGRFLGMISSVVDLDYLIRRLQQVSLTGLMPYVVDSQGRLVAAATAQYATGQDMSHFEIVRSFVGEGSKAQLAATREFTVTRREEDDRDAGNLQSGDFAGLGGGGAEAARRCVSRNLRDAAHRTIAGMAGGICERGPEYSFGAPDHPVRYKCWRSPAGRSHAAIFRSACTSRHALKSANWRRLSTRCPTISNSSSKT